LSAKPETTFIRSVHKHLPPEREFYRVKMSNPYTSGIADCWYSGSTRDLWVEYKFTERLPVRVNLIPDLSKLQLDWLMKRHEEGRNVVVIVGCKDGGVVLPDPLTWSEGVPPSSLKLLSRKDLAVAILSHCSLGAPLCCPSSPL
jgi:hypothetical protein